MEAIMNPATFHMHDIERVLWRIEHLLELLERLGSELPEQHLRESRERLNRLRDDFAAGANQFEALSRAIEGLQECVEELKAKNGRVDDPEP
jgi:hypothetical protein